MAGRSLITLTVALTGLVSSLSAAQPQSQAGLPLRILAGHAVLDDVFLNGKGPFRFFLDTGSQANFIDRKVAAQVGLAPNHRVDVQTRTGNVVLTGVDNVTITVGDAVQAGQELLISPLDAVHRLSMSIDGILGEAFLARFDYLLDLRHKRIVFGAAEPLGGTKSAVRISRTRMIANTSEGRLVIDSGASSVVLYRPISPAGGRVTFATMSGTAELGLERLPRLRFAGREFRDLMAAVAPVRSAKDDDSDGLLPTNLFRSVYVSHSGGFVVIDPQ